VYMFVCRFSCVYLIIFSVLPAALAFLRERSKNEPPEQTQISGLSQDIIDIGHWYL